ncbi:hypothetical protein ROZALSC1DRAFT_25596 [Rozella allomycis CSF55]|uniref:Uncharacterized protein n=1 Tax=Rozella allomycis (strain CSF55) TaxID=988480 RepID=A0A4P9YA98_ROZAC|nr:hypothetical protein ROZALSC1DRAFT_25596 [Rozella allomycis CSF55]
MDITSQLEENLAKIKEVKEDLFHIKSLYETGFDLWSEEDKNRFGTDGKINRDYLNEVKILLMKKENQLREVDIQLRKDLSKLRGGCGSNTTIAERPEIIVDREYLFVALIKSMFIRFIHLTKCYGRRIFKTYFDQDYSMDDLRTINCIRAIVGGPGSGKSKMLDCLPRIVDYLDKIDSEINTEYIEMYNNFKNILRNTLFICITLNGRSEYSPNETSPVANRILAMYTKGVMFEPKNFYFKKEKNDRTNIGKVLKAIRQHSGKTHLVLGIDEISKAGNDTINILKCLSPFLHQTNEEIRDRYFDLVVTSLALDSLMTYKIESRLVKFYGLKPLVSIDQLIGKDEDINNPTLAMAISDCGGHPRSIEYVIEAFRVYL